MRRPNMCNNSIGVADDAYKPSNNAPTVKDDSRVSLVRRVLGGSRRKDGNCSSSKGKQFGTPLCEIQLNKNSIPKVLHRICVYIEAHGMGMKGLFQLHGGNTHCIESLKVKLNEDSDADLEGVDDVHSIALLLIVWLKELPQPLLSQETVSTLVSRMHKYKDDRWWGPVCLESILTSGTLATNVVETVLHLLHKYTVNHPSSMSYIPNVFCPLLTCEEFNISCLDAVKLTGKLIEDYNMIFSKRQRDAETITHKGQSKVIVADSRPSQIQIKLRDKLERCVRLDRQFVRSNSEERPTTNNSCNGCAKEDSMRRVSSHEDFSKSKQHKSYRQETQFKKAAQPLHERNSCSPQRQHDNVNEATLVGYASELYDENEHERRRHSERFAPEHGARRNGGRKRRTKHFRSHSPAKENKTVEIQLQHQCNETMTESKTVTETTKPNSTYPSSDLSRGYIKNEKDLEKKDEEDRSPSPISGVASPTLDLNTFHHGEMNCSDDPIPSTPWSPLAPSEERLVSPRNSLVISRRKYSAAISTFEEEPSVLDLATQINNLKRKLKKYNEGFEREFGYKPSHADRMANPDTKKMCSLLSKLKRQLKVTKEECMRISTSEKKTLKEEVIHEIEKRLCEKRAAGDRGDVIELMTHEQLVDEKAAMQKVLLQLEASFGRPSSKEERDMVRDLYDRYRAVKRLLLRHAPSKIRESMNELGTIHEHETMDFSASPPASPPPPPPLEFSPVSSNSEVLSERKTPELVLDNLHSLPAKELLELQRATRDEKKKLRRNLKEYEMEYQAKTGRRLPKDERDSLHPIYVNYKQVKAKLRLIDALVTKMK